MADKKLNHLEAFQYDSKKNELTILDQLSLPDETKYVRVNNAEEGYDVIAKMMVRGAPLIGAVSVLSVVVEMVSSECEDKSALCHLVTSRCHRVCGARPTAVNLKHMTDWLVGICKQAESEDKLLTVEDMKNSVVMSCNEMIRSEYASNVSLGECGAKHLIERCDPNPLHVLTHCNTGSLATVGYGTALGVVHSLHSHNKLASLHYTESRPYLQGARLTASEVAHANLPHATLIPDSATAHLMQSRQIDCVIVGADRVARNGDTANKIGTLAIAVCAKHYHVPFYVAAPANTVDLNLKSGAEIEIEERDGREMMWYMGVRVAPHGTKCWNPAFDVTPADLITGGIITQFGVHEANCLPDQLLPHPKLS